jgi:GT2 family glycosyltransferase
MKSTDRRLPGQDALGANSSTAELENPTLCREVAARGRVSVVICSYSEERWSVLCRAVSSVLAQTHSSVDLVLVVDHNRALLERVGAQWPHLRVVENLGEPGLASARNTGVSNARGDIVAFLDDDAIAEPAWLERLVAEYSDPAVMAAGGSIDPVWPERRPWWFPTEFDWVVGCTYRGMPVGNSDVRNLIGANMSFRRDVLLTIGGFRADLGRVGNYPAGCEETELCMRASSSLPDRIIRYVPAARVDHVVSDERTRWRYYRARCFAEGRSKAIVAALPTSPRGLDTELDYSLSTLPRGVAKGVGDVIVRGDMGGGGRVVAIVGGLAATTAGFLLGRARSALGPSSGSDAEADLA